MPDVPQDPRQLARDILSGKISIEQLAREQQRRRAAAQGNPPPLTQPPLARQVPQPATRDIRSIDANRPVPLPTRPQQQVARQPLPPPRQFPQQQRRPVPPVKAPRAPSSAPLPSASPTTRAPSEEPYAPRQPQAAAVVIRPRAGINRLLTSRADIRRAVLLSEILQPPVSMREPW